MNLAAGVLLMAASLGLVAVAVWIVRPRTSTPAFVLTLAVSGAGLGIGALLCMNDVGIASWFLTPIVMVVLTIAHTMAMVAGSGPLRT